MKAAFIIKKGPADQAFEIREIPKPEPQAGFVRIKVEAFGLNFADVMARLGLYPAAPPLPSLIGYDVVGTIDAVGEEVSGLSVGQRVLALTRFGGYAEYACTDARAVAVIGEKMSAGVAVAIPTQGGTAYHMAEEMVRLFPGDKVLVHAAAGGVGTILCQIAKHRGCEVYGTAGSAKKLAYLKEMGVDHPINYREADFAEVIRQQLGEKGGLDVIFDPVGGDSVKKGLGLLGASGRLIAFGASSMTNAKNIFAKIRTGLAFGFYHPIKLIGPSKGLIGVNMLSIADNRPDILSRVLKSTVMLAESGVIHPTIGGEFTIDELAKAHHLLETRQTMGKLLVRWA
ncbi:MAG: zinc-binding dehydrogenase [Bacteroidota bacterium]